MVRGYAKLLETDPEPVLGALDQRYLPGEIDLDLRDKGIPFARPGKRGTRNFLALSVLALVVVAGVLYEWRAGAFPWARFESNTAPPQAQAKAPPVIPPAAPPAPIEVAAAPPASVAETPAAQVQRPPSGGGGGVVGEARIRLEVDPEAWGEIRERGRQAPMAQFEPPRNRRGA